MQRTKIAVLTILLAMILMVGCGADTPSEEITLSPASKESQLPQASSKEEGSASGESVEAGSASAESVVEESMDGDATAPEESAYVLTFEATTIDGEIVTSDCFAQSKLTMLNIWGTYCNPCLMEMPDLGEIAASYDTADFQIMGIICDVVEGANQSDMDNAKSLIEETGANYPHLLLSESLYTNLVGGTEAVPTTFFVNDKGEVLGYVVGANSKETWVNLIEQLLAEME